MALDKVEVQSNSWRKHPLDCRLRIRDYSVEPSRGSSVLIFCPAEDDPHDTDKSPLFANIANIYISRKDVSNIRSARLRLHNLRNVRKAKEKAHLNNVATFRSMLQSQSVRNISKFSAMQHTENDDWFKQRKALAQEENFLASMCSNWSKVQILEKDNKSIRIAPEGLTHGWYHVKVPQDHRNDKARLLLIHCDVSNDGFAFSRQTIFGRCSFVRDHVCEKYSANCPYGIKVHGNKRIGISHLQWTIKRVRMIQSNRMISEIKSEVDDAANILISLQNNETEKVDSESIDEEERID